MYGRTGLTARLRQAVVAGCLVTGLLWLLGFEVARPGGFLGGPTRAGWFAEDSAEPASGHVDIARR